MMAIAPAPRQPRTFMPDLTEMLTGSPCGPACVRCSTGVLRVEEIDARQPLRGSRRDPLGSTRPATSISRCMRRGPNGAVTVGVGPIASARGKRSRNRAIRHLTHRLIGLSESS